MNEEQINEAMRLGELWAAYAWKACSHGADETVKSQAGRAALEAYLRTIGEPESVNAELLEALKDARHCIGIDRDALVDCHTNPCTGYLDPDGALAKAEYDDVIDAADAAIARAESAIETPAKVSPCAGHAVQQDADEAKICATCRFLTKNGGCQSKGTSYNCVDYCQWEANESGGA